MSGLQRLPFGFLALRAGTLALRPVPETPESERQRARKGICLPKKDGMPARGGASGVPARGPHAAASARACLKGRL